MRILFLVLYLLTIVTIIFVERKSPTEAVLWVMVVVCLPYVGLVLYLIFGSTMAIKMTAYARKKRLGECQPEQRTREVLENGYPLSDEDRQVIAFNRAYNDSRLTCYDDAKIFTTGQSHYRQLFSDIAKAKSCIYVEFYTIHHDEMGEALVEALTKKAGEGVKVLVMLDFLANVSTPGKMFAPLRKAGGKVVRVKPYLTHYRSHRKIVVIDHETAYIGGMNMGAKYADLDKVKTPWRDTQVRLTGMCASVLDEYFLTDWLCSVPRRQWQNTISYVESLPHMVHEENENLCQFIVGGVDTRKESVKMCYLSMIRSAKHRIRIQTPYFIPDASILDALKTAAAAGVQIQLMIPGIEASFFLDPVTRYYCGQLLEYGAEVYRYQGYVHAKTMVIDEEMCCIGSVNMDMRSLQVDDEICGVFYANELACRYSTLYDRDLERCQQYSYEEFQSRSAGKRLAESVFLLFAPLM